MQWYQIKEQSAGRKRLILSWYLYKIFGKNILYLISFLVSFFTFLFAPNVRYYSKKYFKTTYEYLKIKPSLLNCFKHIHAYADSLVDNLLVLCGDYSPDNIVFENKNDENEFSADISKKQGLFLICNHIGNIGVFQSHFLKNTNKNMNINIFMSRKQSQIFAQFLDKIKLNFPVTLFPVEETGVDTGVRLKENLNRGDIVFIAGDRLAQDNDKKAIKATMFERKILLPKGTFKLAKLMEVPVYFVSILKEGNGYKIYLEKQNEISEQALYTSFVKFMERIVKIDPFQFFNFYDFFEC